MSTFSQKGKKKLFIENVKSLKHINPLKIISINRTLNYEVFPNPFLFAEHALVLHDVFHSVDHQF